jgi:hypothetical protein
VRSSYLRKGLDGAVASAQGNCGRKRMENDMKSLQGILYEKRGTVISTVKCLGISMSTLQDHIAYGDFKIVRSTVKPMLTEANKFQHLLYCLEKLTPQPDNGIAVFNEDYNTIHVDEMVREGNLSTSLAVTTQIYNDCHQYLLDNGYSP